MDFNLLTNLLSIGKYGVNWIDILLILIIVVFVVEGYFLGFFSALIDFVSFILSFVLGLTLYSVIAKLLVQYLNIPQGFANAIGFLAIAILLEILINVILKKVALNIPIFIKNNPKTNNLIFIEKLFGTIPGFFSGLVLSAFIFSLLIALPFSVFLKHSVTNSKFGSLVVANTQVFAKSLNEIFGGAVNDTLSFLTIEPKSNQIVDLKFKLKPKEITIDKEAEKNMLALVNKERKLRNLKEVTFSESLTNLARTHCKDMFVRGYFSHYTPEGLTPFDRMTQYDIAFNFAGENLALAPNTDLAMRGLMQSPGHKANILSSDFAKLGVGVLDGGIYGQMFCQEFTD